MHASGAFQLVIEPETDTRPMRATVVQVDARPDERGTEKMSRVHEPRHAGGRHQCPSGRA